MSFSQGQQAIAIPGPSPLPASVLRAMHRASPDIYGAELEELVQRVHAQLTRLGGGGVARLASYAGNGHAGWEAANTNLFNRRQKALVLATGSFGLGWAASAGSLGIDVEMIDFGNNRAADPQRLADRLRADREGAIHAVLVTQVDTASGVRNDIPALRAAMGNHPALLAVDAIASLGSEAMRMGDWGVDVVVSASQKGLMTPPGMAFVWQSERAAALPRSDLATPYWDWSMRAGPGEAWRYWGGTPPVQLLFALDEALRLLLDEEGLDAAFARHAGLAAAVWAAFDAWGAGSNGIALNVADPAQRGLPVTAAHLPGAAALREWTATKAGVTLGVAIGAERPDDALRIAHMGHASAHMTLGVLAVMEAGMRALGIAHGQGGLDAATAVIAARA
ncbi:alanine--glyoxylate aminotransferase family protein [Paracoccus suum]|uniref:Alanine--glyoxylate aminotransferase family protein n=1 Tax=Paracoccus suum TaxID=2259340 RepID=A0A344PJ62_9RHOB|nr:aminotransferase class V-fold PLP-dependent enzyme [Paracoccus suum]AXC49417.1 alanine--glyoxylate aminotransferase family protein [Paracoccus suum]